MNYSHYPRGAILCECANERRAALGVYYARKAAFEVQPLVLSFALSASIDDIDRGDLVLFETLPMAFAMVD